MFVPLAVELRGTNVLKTGVWRGETSDRQNRKPLRESSMRFYMDRDVADVETLRQQCFELVGDLVRLLGR